MEEEIAQLADRKDKLQKKLSDPEIFSDSKKVKELSIELSKIEKKLEQLVEKKEINKKIGEFEEVLGGNDNELKQIAQDEIKELSKKLRELEKNEKKDEGALPQNIIMEIRAGAGGHEASLFARELFTMYNRYAEKQKWQVAFLDESKSDLGGYKEVIFEINGENVYDTLRYESGVHRVQRIPETEKSGRIHTSTASVAVLPKAREVDIEINPRDIKIEFFRSSGPGGQNVNKVETAVRIYHLKSGVVVSSQDSRSQQKNREKAMEILRSKLLDAKLREDAKKTADARRKQIGTGDRSEKIRTYNFPQNRVTDHRIKESWYNIEAIMSGDLKPIIESLQNSINVLG